MNQAGSGAVLITGCSTGIGHATAARLARRGHTVYATARRPETLSDLAAQGCRTLALDVTDEASMGAAVAAVEEQAGGIEVLVNNAGYSQGGPLEEVPLDEVRRQFETNVFGLLRMCQLVLPGMRRRRSGRIVNVGSMGGRLSFPGGGRYHATKHALEAISDALRFELRGFGIDVILLEPGLITTEFGETASGSMTAVETVESSDEDPYARFNATVGAVTKGAYDGPMRLLGGGPERVAKVIERAISRRSPPARITITPSAKLTIATRRLMPDRLWDAAMRRQFPPPG
jgi:NADP-dependent 3-hydroxy acid dehydrogenase YdfG